MPHTVSVSPMCDPASLAAMAPVGQLELGASVGGAVGGIVGVAGGLGDLGGLGVLVPGELTVPVVGAVLVPGLARTNDAPGGNEPRNELEGVIGTLTTPLAPGLAGPVTDVQPATMISTPTQASAAGNFMREDIMRRASSFAFADAIGGW
jgi:hypothetical protein